MDQHQQSVNRILAQQFQHLDLIEQKITKENKTLKNYNKKLKNSDFLGQILDTQKQILEEKNHKKNIANTNKKTTKQNIAITPANKTSKYKPKNQPSKQKVNNKSALQKKNANKNRKKSSQQTDKSSNKSKLKSETYLVNNKEKDKNSKTDTIKKISSKQNIKSDNKTRHRRSGTMAESHRIIPLNKRNFKNKNTGDQKNFVEEIDINTGDFFQCDLDEIKGDLDNELDYQQPFDKGARKTMNNFDKMFLLEMMEEPISEDEIPEKNLLDDLNPLTITTYKKYFQYSNKTKENLFKCNKTFYLLWCEKLIKKLKKDSLQIEQEKMQYVQEFGVIPIDQQSKFEFSFFSDFYLKQIENEYLKIREEFESNSILDCYLKIFSALDSFEYTPDQEGVPALIRQIKYFQPKQVDILCKLQAEKLILQEQNIFEPGFAFKKNNLTGYICHILRDIVFYYGIISNMQHTLPEQYNTQQRYKFLIEKKKFLEKKLKKIERVFKKQLIDLTLHIKIHYQIKNLKQIFNFLN